MRLDEDFLIIYDNADNPSLLNSCWPHSVRESVIITSRNPSAREVDLAQSSLHLKTFSPEQGSAYIRSTLPDAHLENDDDLIAIEHLARYFDGLPLALRQASTFMRKKHCSPNQFRQLYQRHFEEIDGYKIAEYDKTLSDVWTLSTSLLSDDSLVLLDSLSLLDPDSIPAGLFELADLNHEFGTFLKDELRVLDAREGLTQQSLVDYDYHSSSMSMHRLFREVTFRKLKKDHDRLQKVSDLVIRMIHKFSPEVNHSTVRNPHIWKRVEKTLSHVQSVYDRCMHVLTEREAEMLLRCLTKIVKYVPPQLLAPCRVNAA